MIAIGNFFFKYRNVLFIFLYLSFLIPSRGIFTPAWFGDNYHFWPLIIGLCVTISGQVIRAATIGLAYIIRGGRDKKIYADKLVTEGIFNHCRNPLYVGNILMLLGVGILANSLFYVLVIIPVFLFIYQAIVLAEENFLRHKFGDQFNRYCNRVNRWLVNFTGLQKTFTSMHFNSKRWVLKEYNTLFVWITGISIIILFKYPSITANNSELRNVLLLTIVVSFGLLYLFIRYLKKTGKMTE